MVKRNSLKLKAKEFCLEHYSAIVFIIASAFVPTVVLLGVFLLLIVWGI